MKNVSSSFQYLERAAEMASVLSSLGCPTRRGTSFTLRLQVSSGRLALQLWMTHSPKIWRMYGRCISSECSSSSTLLFMSMKRRDLRRSAMAVPAQHSVCR